MISIIIWLFSGAVGTLIGIINNMYFNEEKKLGKEVWTDIYKFYSRSHKPLHFPCTTYYEW